MLAITPSQLCLGTQRGEEADDEADVSPQGPELTVNWNYYYYYYYYY